MDFSKKYEELDEQLKLAQFPLSQKYSIQWLVENEMGPCSVWLTEFVIEKMNIVPGMRVLDLGCGKAMSSIFLAKECGAQVWACDLWISATDNWNRVLIAGVSELVYPIQAEAHALPFAHDFFDAIVGIDSYHYFGTEDTYLSYLSRFLKPGGQIGIVVPSVVKEFEGKIPERIASYWEPYLFTHHSPLWWRSHWQKSNTVTVEVSDVMSNGFEIWTKWDKTLIEAGVLKRNGDVQMLEADGGNFTFCRVIARKHNA